VCQNEVFYFFRHVLQRDHGWVGAKGENS